MIKVIMISLLMLVGTYSAANTNNIALNICENIAADNKNKLRNVLNANKVKLRHLFASVRCNQKDFITFAADKNSVSTAGYIIKKIPRKDLRSVYSSVKATGNLEVVALIDERLK